jgi:hypothetical protein
MGSSCSCIKSNEPQTELQVDAVRMKEIGIYVYLSSNENKKYT